MQPKTHTDDPEEFRERWNDYIADLNRLKLSLPVDQQVHEEFDMAVATLNDLVDVAADEVSE